MNEPTQRPAEMLYGRALVDEDSLADDSRSVDVIASTEAIDAHGTRVVQNWDFTRFAENPVVLWAHDSRAMPIGLARNFGVVDGKLRATLDFDDDEDAERILRKMKKKLVRGISVGFYPHSVRVVTEEDREFVELDDNELFEISVTPLPSNPEALANLRARAIGASRVEEKQEEKDNMSDLLKALGAKDEAEAVRIVSELRAQKEFKPIDPTPSVARALGLPAGASEADMLAASARMRELEIQVIAITGCKSADQALGAIRGLKESADKVETISAEVVKLREQRDRQDFDNLIRQGKTPPVKLSEASAQFYTELFEKKATEGRGSEIVEQLRGFLEKAPTVLEQRVRQPTDPKQVGDHLTWNGRTYDQLKPMERHQLWKENSELYELMRAANPAA